jgi:hypothetical protein
MLECIQDEVPLRDRTLVIWDDIACVHDHLAFDQPLQQPLAHEST